MDDDSTMVGPSDGWPWTCYLLADGGWGFFLGERTATASQIDFVNLVIGHLTRHGEMDPKLLFEPPFTDAAPQGPTQLFAPEQTKRLLGVIRSINESVGASA